jgi:hypothetical protein
MHAFSRVEMTPEPPGNMRPEDRNPVFLTLYTRSNHFSNNIERDIFDVVTSLTTGDNQRKMQFE